MKDVPDHPNVTAALLVKYIEGDCTDAEHAVIESWKASAPAADRAILELPKLLKAHARQSTMDAFRASNPLAGSPVDILAVSPADIRRRADNILEGRITQHARYGNAWHVFAVAIVALVVVVAGWMTISNTVHDNDGGQPSSYATAAGERSTVILPDGSSVVLSVASRLDVPANYGASDRNLYLEGEGLFTVASASDKPFVVYTGTTSTRVLGTTFSIRRYNTDSTVSIAVKDGKVAVGQSVLSAGQQIYIGRDFISPIEAIAAERFDFATGQLSIDNMLVKDAVIELNRWYDIDVRIGDAELNQRRIKGQFKSESLADLAAILEWSLGARVVREGRTLTLFREL